jgi:hypothetical protein
MKWMDGWMDGWMDVKTEKKERKELDLILYLCRMKPEKI